MIGLDAEYCNCPNCDNSVSGGHGSIGNAVICSFCMLNPEKLNPKRIKERLQWSGWKTAEIELTVESVQQFRSDRRGMSRRRTLA